LEGCLWQHLTGQAEDRGQKQKEIEKRKERTDDRCQKSEGIRKKDKSEDN
jgi:hypothetical protein